MAQILRTLVVLGVFVQSMAFQKCPHTLGKMPIDEEKLSGEWNLIAGTPMFGEKLTRCGKFSLKHLRYEGNNSMNLHYSALEADSDKSVAYEVLSQPIFPEKASASIGVWRKEGTTEWSGIYKHSVVATDYDNYAVFIVCRQTFDPRTNSFGRHLIAQIWGRNTSLKQDVLDTLLNVISGYDIDVSKIRQVDRSNCS